MYHEDSVRHKNKSKKSKIYRFFFLLFSFFSVLDVEDSEKVGRKFSTESQASFNSDETETNTQYSSIHIDEVVNVTDVPQESNSKPSLRVENFSTDISEYGNDDFEVVSDFRSDNEEDEIFNSEILNLRNQIEHINGTMANNKTHNVMPYDEKLLFRSILNKVKYDNLHKIDDDVHLMP